jgi:hypothetical protein
MDTKEALKKEIEKLSDKEANRLYAYLNEIRRKSRNKKGATIPSFKLKGQLDHLNIRSLGNE